MTPETIKAVIAVPNGLTTQKPSNGYDPIVALAQPMSGTYTVSFSAVEKQAETDYESPPTTPNTINFKIMITNLIQQNLDANGNWKPVALNEKPFDVSGIPINEQVDVDKLEQYVISFSISKKYLGGFPVRLVIFFKMANEDGTDPYEGTFAVQHPSSN